MPSRQERLRYPDRVWARRRTHYQVSRGLLPRPSTLSCALCGRPAQEYDHYLGYEPEYVLTVRPLCIPCHRRQPMSRRRSIEEGAAWIRPRKQKEVRKMAMQEGTLTILVDVPASFKREFLEVCRKRGTSQTQAVQDALLTWMVAQDELIARAHKPGLSGDR